MSKKSNPEFERFDKTMDVLLSHSHGDLKSALDAEKAEKANRKQQAKKAKGKGK